MINSTANYNALLGRDWIHANWCVSSSLYQFLLFWKRDEVEVVWLDKQPFIATLDFVEASYYDQESGPIKFKGKKKNGALRKYTWRKKFRLKIWSKLLLKWKTKKPKVRDPMEDVNLGTMEEPMITYISSLLSTNLKEYIISVLQEFKDSFAWIYDEMLGLDRGLVEHRLPLKPKFHHFQQPPRRMSKEVELKVKEEIEKLLKAKFIMFTRYVQWLANIVHVMKKNGKLQVYVDFRDLNIATHKDIYVMPIVDMLANSIANNELLSFVDDFFG